MLPAAYGDCLLITYGSRQLHHMLIDAGTQPTWHDHLRPHLEREGVEWLQLFVLTHIDADHIAGVIPMLEDPDPPVEIGEVWFNSRQHLAGRFLSVKQGEQFSTLIRERKLPWNEQFGERAVCVDEGPAAVKLAGGLQLTVLSPTRARLDRLARVWKREDHRHFLRGGAATPRRCQFWPPDPTPSTDVPALAATKFKSDSTASSNGSSIALLAEFGSKSILLAGDAYAQVLSKSIKALRPVWHASSLVPSRCPIMGAGETRAFACSTCCMQALPDLLQRRGASPTGQRGDRADHRARWTRPSSTLDHHCKRTEDWDDDALRTRYGFTTEYGNDGFLRLDL